MKITQLITRQVEIPLEKPLITAIHKTESIACVLVSLETNEGLRGENYVFTLDKTRISVLESMIQSLKHHVIDQNPLYVEQIWQSMWVDINPIGQSGVAVSAISAIDTALWDLIGKQAGLPLYQLFGACRDSIKAYASSGLWLSASIDELVDEGLQFIDQGFNSMKLRIGKPDLNEDVARVAALREAVGDSIEILVDANQSLSAKQAIQLAGRLEEYNLGWFEEPVHYQDLQSHARVLQSSPIPLATGESGYTRFDMKAILDAGAADVLMPDLQRIGGLSEFRKTAAMASAYHIPISTHIFTEQSLSIAGSSANCISVEHVSWFSPLYQENMHIHEGKIDMPQGAGLGFTFDEDFISHHQMK